MNPVSEIRHLIRTINTEIDKIKKVIVLIFEMIIQNDGNISV